VAFSISRKDDFNLFESHNYKNIMICRALRLSKIIKPACTKMMHFPQIRGLSTNSVFCFSEDKKTPPIKSSGIKPTPSNEPDNSIEA